VEPLQQCLAVNTWSLLMMLVVLPLYFSFQSERRARRQFEAQQRLGRREGQPPGAAAGARATACAAASCEPCRPAAAVSGLQWPLRLRSLAPPLPQPSTSLVRPLWTPPPLQTLHAPHPAPQRPPLSWATDIYMLSCLAWAVANAALLLS
jgi:hypothetical protein